MMCDILVMREEEEKGAPQNTVKSGDWWSYLCGTGVCRTIHEEQCQLLLCLRRLVEF